MADDTWIDVADLHNTAAEGQSFLDKTEDWFAKGIPVALGSGVTSILNTGISLGNVFGGDAEKIDYAQNLREYDDDLLKYYEEHKAGADLGGFLLTSLVPGGLGMKGLKAIQTMKTGEGIGANVQAVAGFFANKQEKYLKAAAQTLKDPSQQVYGIINRDKILSIAAGFGEQALQGAVFETAVLLTMNQNPVMEPNERDSYVSAITGHLGQAVLNAGLFGVAGGLLGAAGFTGKVNKLIQKADEDAFPQLYGAKIGVSKLDPGQQVVHFLDELIDMKDSLKAIREQEGIVLADGTRAPLDLKKVQQQELTIKNYEQELHEYISKRLIPDSPELAEAFREALQKVKPFKEHGYEVPIIEAYARFLGGANIVRRVGEGVTGDINKFIGLNPHATRDSLSEIESGTVIINKSKHHFPFVAEDKSRIMNLVTGEITAEVYPRWQDLRKAKMEDGVLSLRDETFKGTEKTPEKYDVKKLAAKYDPIENPPMDSSAQFWRAQSLKDIPEELSVKDIPMLEAAVLRGKINGIDVTVSDYTGNANQLGRILDEVKRAKILELMEAGKNHEYISRAVNVPREFIETGEGKSILGSIGKDALEDFEKPVYAQIQYARKRIMDKFEAEGILKLQGDLKLAITERMNAAAVIFGEDAVKNLPPPGAELKNVGSISGTSGFVTAADAVRGSTTMYAMQVGKMIAKLAPEEATRWQNVLYPLRQEILADPAKKYLRNINAGKLRAAPEDMIRLPEEMHPGAKEENLVLVYRSWIDAAIRDANPVQWIQNRIAQQPSVLINEPLQSAEAQYLIVRQQLTSEQVRKWNISNKALGKPEEIKLDAFYEPPIDTTRQPYFALVRSSNPLHDLRPQSMIVAQSAEKLDQMIADLRAKHGDLLEIFTKDDIKHNKKLAGTFDSGMLFSKTEIDSALHSEGKMFEYVPRKDDYIFKEEDQWIWRQSQALYRQGAELMYAKEIAELRFLENNWNKSLSRMGGETAVEKAKNPYTQVINTYLNLNNRDVYHEFWGKLNEGAQAAWNAMTDAWRTGYKAAQKGELSFEEAEAIAQKAGYTAPFGELSKEVFRETFKDQNSLSKFVSKVNMAVSTLMIRMDALNAAVNIISLPVLLAAENSKVRRQVVESLGLDITVPGSTHAIPSTMELLYKGTKAMINGEKITVGGQEIKFSDWLEQIAGIRTIPQQLADSIAIPMSALATKDGALAWSANLAKNVGDWGAKVTGNDLAENYVRYLAGYSAFKMAQAQGITHAGELAAYVNLGINRVHGNHLATQRPTIFSGPVGQAIGLFQTYQFNMIQQMTKHLQEGNLKSATIALAMQNTIFGLQSSPLFWQLNKYIGNANADHGDIVTGIGNLVGTGTPDVETAFGHKISTDPAKWLLYGLGANILGINLYNRGDLTPRNITVLPTSLPEVPSVSVLTKTIGSFLDSAKNIANGAPVADSILQGVAHAGFNRPLAGLATLASGKKTSSNGSLLAAYNDMDAFTVAAKLAGGEPMNNAVAIDAFYRQQQYKTDAAKRMQDLGEAVKLTSQNQLLDPSKTQEFMTEYAKIGGDMKNFNRSMIGWTKDANQNLIKQAKNQMSSPLAQRQLSWLGADLPENLVPTPAEEESESSTP